MEARFESWCKKLAYGLQDGDWNHTSYNKEKGSQECLQVEHGNAEGETKKVPMQMWSLAFCGDRGEGPLWKMLAG